MKQSLARTLLILSLVLSLASFVLSVIALNLPSWKSIQLRSSFVPVVAVDHNPMDPLIRGEVNKYIDSLYRRGKRTEDIRRYHLLPFIPRRNPCVRSANPLYQRRRRPVWP